MSFIGTPSSDGKVVERLFSLEVSGRVVPGVLWGPEEDDPSSHLVLMGHGGTFGGHGHKKAPWMVDGAHRYVAAGLSVAAIDMPSAGDRPGAAEEAKARAGWTIEEALERLWTDQSIDETIEDWQATLDFLQSDAVLGAGPVGYQGLSGGTTYGLPFVAADDRVKAAILGLNGATDRNMRDAPNVTCAVLYLINLQDQFGPPETGLTLFDALGSTDKRIHAHPGGHGAIPPDEFDDCVRFLVSRLAAAGQDELAGAGRSSG